MNQTTNNTSETPSISANPGPSLFTTSGEPNWKLISFILLILLFLLIAVTVGAEMLRPKNLPYSPQIPQVTPTPSQKKPHPILSPTGSFPTPFKSEIPPNWKTYTNSYFGYAISYPSAWTAKLSIPDGGYQEAKPDSIMVDLILPTSDLGYPYNTISIEPIQFTDDKSFLNRLDWYRSWQLEKQSESRIRINNADAFIFEGLSTVTDKPFYSKVYVIKLPQRKEAITILTRDTLTRNNKELMEKILSTFRFLDSTPSPSATATQNAVSISQTTIDFSSCNEGGNFLKAGASRSTTLTIIKDKGDTCQLEITSEIEGSYTTSVCEVPKSLGIVELTLTNSGADFTLINPYCQEN